MTLCITNHAVDRYAERVMGIAPDTLNERERAMIRIAIRKAIPDAGEKVSTWSVKRRDAIYIVENRSVVTVLCPTQRIRHQASAKARRARAAAGVHP